MGHPDFRVGGRIFATLDYPGEGYGVVMLSPEEQAVFVAEDPSAFTPVKGAWGRRGCTRVRLAAVNVVTLENAIVLTWRRKAPARLANLHTKPDKSPKSQSARN